MYWKIITILGIFLIFVSIYNHIQISDIFVNKLNFDNKKLSSVLRITQISDYHANNRIDSKKLLDEIIHFNPHIIVLTGDIIDSKTKDIYPTLSLIRKLVGINSNIFFVIGNHELGNKNGGRFISSLKEMGVIVLDNNRQTVEIEGERINICGLSFFATRKDYEETMKGIDKGDYTLLLSHSPNRPIDYSLGIEDLVLTGHTHGGQVRLPIIGAIISPGQGLFPKFDKGVFKI
ncbi:metallophosphoesterase, partial [Clostridium sp. Cult2]|uniref:metallophosphoesterase n=1 Tax=Clostridium sp. Cult2 TaxID=2079003 RepID=UPI001F47CD2A